MINHSDFLMQRFKETVERNKQSIFLTDLTARKILAMQKSANVSFKLRIFRISDTTAIYISESYFKSTCSKILKHNI